MRPSGPDRARPRAGRGPGLALGLALAVAGLGATGLAGGCATHHPHGTLDISVDVAAVRRALALPPGLEGERALPAVAVLAYIVPEERPGTIRGAAAATPGPAAADPAEDSDLLAFDGTVVGREVISSLESTGLFTAVFAVGDPLGPPDIHAASADARRRGASLLIDVGIEAPRLRLVDRDFVLPIVAWTFLGFPSFWFHNHTYALDFGMRMRLYDLNTDRPLPERSIPPARVEEALNFYERTSSLPTYLLTNVLPSPFCPVDENKVAATLAARAVGKPLGDFLEQVALSFRGRPYTFSVQKKVGGSEIAVEYPPDGKPVHLLEDLARLSFAVAAPAGRTVAQVKFGDRLVFPVQAERRGEPPPPRLAIRLETTQPIEPGRPLVLTVTDSAGGVSTCLLVATREPATRSASGPAGGTKVAEESGREAGAGPR